MTTNATPPPVLHDVHVSGDLSGRIGPCPAPVDLGAHPLAGALAEANRLHALHRNTNAKGTR